MTVKTNGRLAAKAAVLPDEGMPIRKRRQVIPGFKFHFGDMPAGIDDRPLR